MQHPLIRRLRRLLGPARRKCEADVVWFRRRLVLAASLDGRLDQRAKVPVEFHFGSIQEVLALTPGDHEYGEPNKALARRRLAAGDRVVLGIHDGAVVYYSWVMAAQFDMDCERLIPMSADRAYSYKVFTVRSRRGLNICPAAYSWLRERLRAEGRRQLICQILAGNTASLRAHERAGFVNSGQFWEMQVGSRHFYRMAPGLREWLRRPLA